MIFQTTMVTMYDEIKIKKIMRDEDCTWDEASEKNKECKEVTDFF